MVDTHADYTESIHNFQHESFPKAQEPMHVMHHPDHHVPKTGMEHGVGLNTEHQSPSPVNKTFYHNKGPNFKGTTVTSKKTYHG